jgi:hypothetical protein
MPFWEQRQPDSKAASEVMDTLRGDCVESIEGRQAKTVTVERNNGFEIRGSQAGPLSFYVVAPEAISLGLQAATYLIAPLT